MKILFLMCLLTLFLPLMQVQGLEPIGLKGLQILSLSIHPDGTLYAATKRGLFSYTYDKKWEKTGLEEPVFSLSINKKGNIFAGTMKKGLAFSHDKGKTWKYFPLTTKPLRAIYSDEQKVYIGTFEGKIYQKGPKEYALLADIKAPILCIFGDNQKIYAGVGSYEKKSLSGAIYSSMDEGKTWTEKKLEKILPKKMLKSTFLYLATNYGVHRETNLGWSYMGLKGSVQDMVFHPQGYLLAGTKEGLFSCSQEGKAWTRIGRTMDISAISITEKGTIYIGTHHGGVYQYNRSLLEIASSEESATKTRDIGRIIIKFWDVGGGNYFYPKAKVLVGIIGKTANIVKMFAVSSDGYMDDLEFFYCQDGTDYYFNSKYCRATTRWIELRLYDNMGYVIAREIREAD